MTPDQMAATLKQLRAALPALEGFVVEYQRATAEQAGLTAAVAALVAESENWQRRTVEEQAAYEAARLTREREAAAALNLVDERLKDLMRAQKIAEEQLATARAEAAQVRTDQERAHAEAEEAFEGRIAALQRQEAEATSQLTATQAKIQAVHQELAALAGRAS